MTAQVAADLRAAADVLERDGWTQGVYLSSNGGMCVAGAIRKAVHGDPWKPSSRTGIAADALARTVGVRGITHWNDHSERTADEVIAALRAAADKADQAVAS